VSLPDSDNATAADAAQPPAWQVALSVALVVVGGVVVIYGLTRGENGTADADDGPSREKVVAPSAGGVDFAADVPATNDVYRAWLGLREAVDADGVRSPAAVADRAVEAGYSPSGVAGLTDLFCRVRYGESDPTDERERRARDFAERLHLDLEGDP
jgi:hypothetical protein